MHPRILSRLRDVAVTIATESPDADRRAGAVATLIETAATESDRMKWAVIGADLLEAFREGAA